MEIFSDYSLANSKDSRLLLIELLVNNGELEDIFGAAELSLSENSIGSPTSDPLDLVFMDSPPELSLSSIYWIFPLLWSDKWVHYSLDSNLDWNDEVVF